MKTNPVRSAPLPQLSKSNPGLIRDSTSILPKLSLNLKTESIKKISHHEILDLGHRIQHQIDHHYTELKQDALKNMKSEMETAYSLEKAQEIAELKAFHEEEKRLLQQSLKESNKKELQTHLQVLTTKMLNERKRALDEQEESAKLRLKDELEKLNIVWKIKAEKMIESACKEENQKFEKIIYEKEMKHAEEINIQRKNLKTEHELEIRQREIKFSEEKEKEILALKKELNQEKNILTKSITDRFNELELNLRDEIENLKAKNNQLLTEIADKNNEVYKLKTSLLNLEEEYDYYVHSVNSSHTGEASFLIKTPKTVLDLLNESLQPKLCKSYLDSKFNNLEKQLSSVINFPEFSYNEAHKEESDVDEKDIKFEANQINEKFTENFL